MIVDTDNISFDRSSPSPNRHDTLSSGPTMSKGTNSVNYISPSTDRPIITPAKNGQFTVVQTGVIPAVNFTDSTPVGTYKTGRATHGAIPHNLGFTPAIVGYYVNGATYFRLPSYFESTNGNTATMAWLNWAVSVDDTYVYFYTDYLITGITGFAPQNPVPILRYYLLQQTSN